MYVVGAGEPKYPRIVEKKTAQITFRRIIALITCMALVIGSLSFFSGEMDRSAHAVSVVSKETAALTDMHAVHAAHQMQMADDQSDFCPQDAAQSANCHFSACCPPELQFAQLPAPEINTRSADLYTLVTTSVRLQTASLFERPPRNL